MQRAVLAILLATACASQPIAATRAETSDPLRLPRTVVPTAYALALEIDPSQNGFSGHDRITVRLSEPTRRIRLHGQDLNVSQAEFHSGNGAPVVLRYQQLTPDGAAELVSSTDLPAGDGVLELSWTAGFGQHLDGLYQVREGGEPYAFTQFEAIAARKMFPCFDEPGFKAPFDVQVRIRASDVAIGNTPVAEEKADTDGHKTIRFARTAPLPTYLIALAVGPLDVVTGPDIPPNETRAKPIPMRGVATKGKGRLLKYALAHTGELVTILEQYFGLAYPWEKLDLIAVPDFGPGAMENAGAITFKEFLLLLDDKAPPDQRRAYAGVTAHELAHQWFGDLVTMEWWDDIWLNEAFASWMSARVMQRSDPGMKADVSLIASMEDLMGVDSLVSARRIRQPVLTTGDIFNAFDGITYTKGAGVIGMFETWVTPDKFQAGVHDYFEKHRFGTGSTTDFLAAISAAAGRDIAPSFRTFLDQPGVPLLQIERACDGKQETLQIQQERFRPLGSELKGEATWQVPFCFRRDDGVRQCSLIDSARASLPVAGACARWLLPNTSGSGYYRFTLDEPTASALVAARGQLTTTEQLAVIDSIAAAERAGKLDIPTALRLLTPFASASDRRVAAAPMGLLVFLRNEVADEKLRPEVERRSRELYAPLAERLLKQQRDDEENIFLRQVMSFLARIGRDPDIRAKATAQGAHFLRPSTPAPAASVFDDPTMLDLTLGLTMEDGDAAVFDEIVARLRAGPDPLLRARLINALGHAHGALGERARDLALDEILRVSEILPLLRVQFYERETREDAWAWFKTKGEKVIARIDEKHSGGLPSLAGALCSSQSADEVQEYFAPHLARMPGGERTLAGAVEGIRLCAAHKSAQSQQGDAFRAALNASTP